MDITHQPRSSGLIILRSARRLTASNRDESPIFAVYPTVGQRPFLLAFIVIIVGGLGSVRGTLAAAIFLAVVRSLSFMWLQSEEAQALLFVIMIVVLYISPEGLGRWVEA